MTGSVDLDWPSGDITRVPYRLYTDEGLFEREMERIFYASWAYVGLEAEIPNAWDYITTMIGNNTTKLRYNT